MKQEQSNKSKAKLSLRGLVSVISRKFLSIPSDEVCEYFDEALQMIMSTMNLDRSVLARFSEQNNIMMASAVQAVECIHKLPKDSEKEIPWIQARARAGKLTYCSSLEELPKEAARDKAWLTKLDIQSIMIAPVNIEGISIAALTFETIGRSRMWTDNDMRSGVMLADMFGNALSRQNAFLVLQEKESMLQKAQAIAHIGSWAVDIKSQQITCSEEAYNIFGLPFGPALTYEKFGEIIHADDMAYVKESWMNALNKGSFDVEYRIVVAGNLKWVAVKTDIEFNKQNMPVLAVGIVTDITETKKREKAEADVLFLRGELAHATRIVSMGELSGAIAHEINQPLAAILFNTQAAQRFLNRKEPDLEIIRGRLIDIVKDNHRASEIIQRLRAFIKKEKVQFATVDLNGIIREVIAIVKSEIIIKKINLRISLSEGLPFVKCDKIQIQQVIMNLITNACDVLMDQDVNSRTLRITSSLGKDKTIMVKVRDNGKGIDQKTLNKIFDPFYTTKTKGLGLGLSINKSIIEAHSGLIWAERNSDKGMTFFFALPNKGGLTDEKS